MGQLYKLDNSWREVKTIIPFGYGRVGKRTLPTLQQMFSIPFVIDNNPKCVQNNQVEIHDLKTALNKRNNEKIVVLTVGRVYTKIKEELEENGLKEYMDFCLLERFLSEWHIRYQKKCYLSKIDTVITSRCSLSCSHCAMFTRHSKHQRDIAFSALKENFDVLFSVVDYVLEYTLLGGEPLLHKEIKDIITYLGREYVNRIGRIVLISNGNVDVSEELLDVMQEYKIVLAISDYTSIYSYEKRLASLTKQLSKKGISYYFNYEMEWKDHGYPLNPVDIPDERCREHMFACGHTAHSVNFGKLYYCDPMFGAEYNVNYDTKNSDVLDLKELINSYDVYNIKERIIRYCWGEINDRGYPSLCKYCGGIGWDNEKVIPAGT